MENARPAAANFRETYLRLAMAVAGAEAAGGPDIRAVVSPLPHAIGNLAIDPPTDLGSIHRTGSFAQGRPAFHLYLTRPAPSQALAEAGFPPLYELGLMAAEGSDGPWLDVQVASGEERAETARMMAERFFHLQPPEVRAEVARATASVPEFEFCRIVRRGQIVAAAMLSRHSGTCGIYNLCVVPEHRGRGIGTALVRWAMARAADAGELAVLQCDDRAAGWYGSLGFEPEGKVFAFGWDHR